MPTIDFALSSLTLPVGLAAFAASTAVVYALITSSSSVKNIVRFIWNCFFKPIGRGDDQQTALESFYKGQASIYDTTRARLLKGREEALQLAIAHLKRNHDLVWVDVSGQCRTVERPY
jgi:betaine lipid synthase